MDYLPPQEIRCIAAAVYHEARGEGTLGQRAVAHVVLNRAKKRKMTPCQVIMQHGQFHFTMKVSYSGPMWKKALQTAHYPGLDPTGGAHYFHNKRVRPGWGKQVVTIIGNHVFYR